jgi:muconate cycloisomerase
LPGFSPETIGTVRDAWDKLRVPVSGFVPIHSPEELVSSISRFNSILDNCPSLRFAIETALCDLAARHAGIPLSRWFSDGAGESVEVNALVDSASRTDWLSRCTERWSQGYRAFKMKAGVGTPGNDIGRVKVLRDLLPEAGIRIDVNGGWSAEVFRNAAGSLAESNIEFIEQPLGVGNAALARAIAESNGLPLALDEELSSMEVVHRVLDDRLCDVLVVKPMVLGALTGGLELIRECALRKVRIVFTSLWESDIGIAAACHLALAANTGAACGFSTAGAISDGIVGTPLKIENGRMRIPGSAGLGMELCELPAGPP